jgi:hypothetical protein
MKAHHAVADVTEASIAGSGFGSGTVELEKLQLEKILPFNQPTDFFDRVGSNPLNAIGGHGRKAGYDTRLYHAETVAVPVPQLPGIEARKSYLA